MSNADVIGINIAMTILAVAVAVAVVWLASVAGRLARAAWRDRDGRNWPDVVDLEAVRVATSHTRWRNVLWTWLETKRELLSFMRFAGVLGKLGVALVVGGLAIAAFFAISSGFSSLVGKLSVPGAIIIGALIIAYAIAQKSR